MIPISFTVPTIPVAQPRQRHRIMQAGGRTFAHNVTPTTHPVNAFKAAVQLAAREAYAGPPLDGPVSLHVEFYFPRPGRLRWKKRDMPALLHDTKPDLENCLKSLMDALTGIAFHDDRQVAKVSAEKWYTDGGSGPRVKVEVEVVRGQRTEDRGQRTGVSRVA